MKLKEFLVKITPLMTNDGLVIMDDIEFDFAEKINYIRIKKDDMLNYLEYGKKVWISFTDEDGGVGGKFDVKDDMKIFNSRELPEKYIYKLYQRAVKNNFKHLS